MKKNFLIAVVCLFAAGLFTACSNEDNPSKPKKDNRISKIIPDDLRATIEKYIPIYDGVNPPKIEGSYFIDPEILCASSLEWDEIGRKFLSEYDRFYDQDMKKNTISLVRVQGGGTECGRITPKDRYH